MKCITFWKVVVMVIVVLQQLFDYIFGDNNLQKSYVKEISLFNCGVVY